jgi:hypothetical protein
MRPPTALVLFLLVSVAAPLLASDEIVIGTRTSLRSEILGKEVQLSIHVPSGGEDPEARCAVLYTFQTHLEQTFGAVEGLCEYGLIPPLIVVRVDGYEYGHLTPTQVEGSAGSGQADRFLDFFAEELFPFVDAAYRTHPYRIVFSNSWGAMFAVYAVLHRPEVFDAAIASIPWVTYDGEERFLLRNAERFLSSAHHDGHALFMAMDGEPDPLADLEALVGILRDHPRDGLRWTYRPWPEEDHTSTPHRAIHAGLRWIFDAWRTLPRETAAAGPEAVAAYERALAREYGFPLEVSPAGLRAAGQELAESGEPDRAIALFELDAFALVTLGRALEEAGRLAEARTAFAEAHRLAAAQDHPQLRWVKGFLDRIEARPEDEGR